MNTAPPIPPVRVTMTAEAAARATHKAPPCGSPAPAGRHTREAADRAAALVDAATAQAYARDGAVCLRGLLTPA